MARGGRVVHIWSGCVTHVHSSTRFVYPQNSENKVWGGCGILVFQSATKYFVEAVMCSLLTSLKCNARGCKTWQLQNTRYSVVTDIVRINLQKCEKSALYLQGTGVNKNTVHHLHHFVSNIICSSFGFEH